MNIREKVFIELLKNGCGAKDLPGNYPPMDMEINSLKIHIELVDLDRLSCSIRAITLASQEPTAAHDRLEHLSCQVKEKVTYLLEDLELVELDKNSSTLIMRSNPPASDSRYTCYYELLFQDSRLSLARYCYDREINSRKQIPIDLTKEVFVRLVEDLALAIKAYSSWNSATFTSNAHSAVMTMRNMV